MERTSQPISFPCPSTFQGAPSPIQPGLGHLQGSKGSPSCARAPPPSQGRSSVSLSSILQSLHSASATFLYYMSIIWNNLSRRENGKGEKKQEQGL